MAARVIWSQGALDDIDAIADYISRDSPYHAQRVVEEIFELADSIRRIDILAVIHGKRLLESIEGRFK